MTAAVGPDLDDEHMRAALALARRGLGRVWPNPAVGCVLAHGSRVVGRGWTQPGGRPHAETEALRRAGPAAQGATAYVTLEPCAHTGATGPCTEALIAAGVTRAVVAIDDPDPRVSGRGLARLREAGVAVLEGPGAEEAREINAGFLLRQTAGRPLITLKLATSLDGRIAAPGGDSRWITSPAARAQAHRLRAEHDAVLVGAGTATTDDPALTCRLPGMDRRSPVRIVADGRLRLDPGATLVRAAASTPTWILTTPAADPVRAEALGRAGVEIVAVAMDEDGRPGVRAMASALAGRGLTRVLLEGGGRLAAAFVAAGLVDRLAWFQAPKLIGGDGVAAVAELCVARVADAPSFVLRRVRTAGHDVRTDYTAAARGEECSPAS